MCLGGKCPGGKCPGGILCPWGKCPGGTCSWWLSPVTRQVLSNIAHVAI